MTTANALTRLEAFVANDDPNDHRLRVLTVDHVDDIRALCEALRAAMKRTSPNRYADGSRAFRRILWLDGHARAVKTLRTRIRDRLAATERDDG